MKQRPTTWNSKKIDWAALDILYKEIKEQKDSHRMKPATIGDIEDAIAELKESLKNGII